MQKIARHVGMGMAMLLLSTPLLAQIGMPGGGMGDEGGGMDGGMGGGMGGGGGRRGGMGGRMSEGPMGGRPRMAEMKPIKRAKLDKPVQGMFTAADSNHDGIVTLDELKAVLLARRDVVIRARFEKIDTNRDRLIDEKEFIAWQSGLGSVAASEDEAMGDHGGPVAETIAPIVDDDAEGRVLKHLIEPLGATVIANANSNYDKGLSLDELLTYERKRFDDADSDKDGELSAGELQTLMPRGRGRRPGGGAEDGPPGPPPSPDTQRN